MINRNAKVLIVLFTAISLSFVADAQDFARLESNIANQLRAAAVRGVSVAVIVGNRIVWANGIGLAEAGKDQPVKADTLFQAASISKPVAAFGALRLVQDKATHNGKWHNYPEMAAAGLWTTPTDLAKFIIAVQWTNSSRAGAKLNKHLAQEMPTAQTADGPGLGL